MHHTVALRGPLQRYGSSRLGHALKIQQNLLKTQQKKLSKVAKYIDSHGIPVPNSLHQWLNKIMGQESPSLKESPLQVFLGAVGQGPGRDRHIAQVAPWHYLSRPFTPQPVLLRTGLGVILVFSVSLGRLPRGIILIPYIAPQHEFNPRVTCISAELFPSLISLTNHPIWNITYFCIFLL